MLARTSDGSWGGVIHQGYLQSIRLKASGGDLGILLAYPFWNLVGTVLGSILLFLAMTACILLAMNLTPGRIRDLATGKIVIRWGRKPKDQAEQDQRQIAFQQEQERQRQMAYAQQQAYILQQQQAQAAGRSGQELCLPDQLRAVSEEGVLRLTRRKAEKTDLVVPLPLVNDR